jgi:lipid-A-disaccharide synthase
MGRQVFITVAEVSGDKHAAELIRALRELEPSIIVEGIGGPGMAAAGAKIHHETTRAAAMSFHAAARAIDVYRILRWTRAHLQQNRPDLIICVDSPAMNFHFAKLGHALGIPVLYYIAPQLWAWREGRMKKLRKWVDHVACILPFEEAYFRNHGVRATFVGHPLFDELPADRSRADGAIGVKEGRPVIGLLAGSRASEATANFGPMLEVASRIASEFPGAQFVSPTTEATDPIVRSKAAAAGFEGLGVTLNGFDELVRECDLCITVSGTATLHVAGWGVPMIVVYRGNPVLWHVLARWLIKTRTYSLVNLLADRHDHIVPEFIPWFGKSKPVAEQAIEMLRDPTQLARQRSALKRMLRNLDRPGASTNVARLALQMIRGEQEQSLARAQVAR